jgi:pilus assembly protein Flp/PilA
MTRLRAFLRDRSGATAAQYAMIVAITGAGIAIGAIALGDAIGDSARNTARCIRSVASCSVQVDMKPS